MKVLGREEQPIRARGFVCNVPRRKRRSPLCNSDLPLRDIPSWQQLDGVSRALQEQKPMQPGAHWRTKIVECKRFVERTENRFAQVGSRKSCRKCNFGARPSTSCSVGGRSSTPLANASTDSHLRVGSGSLPSSSFHTHNDTWRSTSEETPIARGFRPQHSRGGRVVAEVQDVARTTAIAERAALLPVLLTGPLMHPLFCRETFAVSDRQGVCLPVAFSRCLLD